MFSLSTGRIGYNRRKRKYSDKCWIKFYCKRRIRGPFGTARSRSGQAFATRQMGNLLSSKKSFLICLTWNLNLKTCKLKLIFYELIKKKFIQTLLVTIVRLIFLCIAVYTRKADANNYGKWPPGTPNTCVSQ